MRVLVWQWGRRGAGPRFAAGLAHAIAALPGHAGLLSLSEGAEILRARAAPRDAPSQEGPPQDAPPRCELPVRTYAGLAGFVGRMASAPLLVPRLAARVRALRPDAAVCAMPAPMDPVMAGALRRAGVPYAVVVHDADPHPGDVFPLQMVLQRRLVRGAAGLVALSGHVAERLRRQGLVGGRRLLVASLPPLGYGAPPPPPLAHGGALRLLLFGRLLPYKGLDLLGDALARLGPRPDLEVRVAGSGPESPALDALRRLPGVRVENRWVPEGDVGALLAWSDALVLSHREASQSGVAAAAVAAGRWLVATRVGGLTEQLAGEPLARLCEPTAQGLADALDALLREVHAAAKPRVGTPPRAVAAPRPVDSDAAWRRLARAVLDELEAVATR